MNIMLQHSHLFADRNAESTHNIDENLDISGLNVLRWHFLSFNPLWTQWPLRLHK